VNVRRVTFGHEAEDVEIDFGVHVDFKVDFASAVDNLVQSDLQLE
jgi:hypothetical protein